MKKRILFFVLCTPILICAQSLITPPITNDFEIRLRDSISEYTTNKLVWIYGELDGMFSVCVDFQINDRNGIENVQVIGLDSVGNEMISDFFQPLTFTWLPATNDIGNISYDVSFRIAYSNGFPARVYDFSVTRIIGK